MPLSNPIRSLPTSTIPCPRHRQALLSFQLRRSDESAPSSALFFRHSFRFAWLRCPLHRDPFDLDRPRRVSQRPALYHRVSRLLFRTFFDRFVHGSTAQLCAVASIPSSSTFFPCFFDIPGNSGERRTSPATSLPCGRPRPSLYDPTLVPLVLDPPVTNGSAHLGSQLPLSFLRGSFPRPSSPFDPSPNCCRPALLFKPSAHCAAVSTSRSTQASFRR